MKKNYFLSLLMVFTIVNFSVFRGQTCSGIAGGINLGDDFDGDGICNQDDIDDDNDGVLDVYEMTSCTSELLIPTSASATHHWFNTGSNLTQTINETVTLGTTFGADTYGSNQALVSDSWFSGAQNGTGISFANKPFEAILTYNFSTPINTNRVILWNPDSPNYGGEDNGIKDFSVEVTTQSGQVMIFGPYNATISNAAQVFNFPYGVANVSSVKLLVTDGWYGNNAPSVTSAAARYSAGTMSTNYNMTLREFRMGCAPVDIDTDGDGIPNRLDLDSDGDSCPDAKESGVTGILLSGNVINGTPNTTTSTSNAVAQGPYDANGLANSLENNDTTSAITSYVNTYNSFALNVLLNICTDTDNDGINDFIDIDDDNDGVLDEYEGVKTCSTVGFNLSGMASNPNVGDVVISNRLLTSANSTYAGTTFSFQITEKSGSTASSWVNLRGNNSGDLAFGRGGANSAMAGTFTFSKKIAFTVSENITLAGSTSNNDNYIFTIPAGGYYVIKDRGTADFTVNNATATSVELNFGTTGDNDWSVQFFNIDQLGVRYISTVADNTAPINFLPCNYTDMDLDNDGIVNRLDLDSDGDGCPDAQESGVTGTLLQGNVINGTPNTTTNTPNAVAQGPYGTNGLANALENNDTSSATVNYVSTYGSYASNSLINVCKDSDGDGVTDLNDIDDDNDGILDTNETVCQTPTSNNATLLGPTYYANVVTTFPIFSTYGQTSNIINGVVESRFADITTQGVTYQNNLVFPNTFDVTNKLVLNVNGFYSANDLGSVDDAMRQIEILLYNVYGELVGVEPLTLTNNAFTGVMPFSKSYNNISSWKVNVLSVYNTVGGGSATELQLREIGLQGTVANYCVDKDTDGDGISDRLDLDSDNDGCSDVIEGAAIIGLSNIANSSMPGGNTTATSGNYFQPITTNICLTVDCGSTGVNSLGLPQFSNLPSGYSNTNGQAIGTSENYSAQDPTCTPNPCDITATNPDSDNDGISDYCDLDDDNDGILDTSEGCYDTNFVGNDVNPTGTPSVVGISYPFGTSSTGTTFAPTNFLISPIINPTSVTSMSVGGGFSGSLNGSYSLDITGIDATTLAQAVNNNEYLQFSFTTTAGTFGRYLDWFGLYNRINTNPMYSVTYQISNDGFTSNRTILGSILQVANEGGGTYPVGRRAFNNVNYFLEGSKTYTVRIYLYNVGGTSVTLNFDDAIIVFDYCSLDTDNDITLDYLDLDSDADGCPDAIEGGDDVTMSMLDTSKRINVAADGVTTPIVVDSQGVPIVVNSGGAAENSTIEQGQSVGTSATTNPLLTAGTTSSNQNINTGQTPAAISLSGSTGSVQWQSSTDNITFTNISGATTSTYSPGALTVTTYYRAILTSVGGCSTTSNVITITVETVCHNPVINYDNTDPTNHGVTLLKRAGANNGNWPMIRNSGFTALESNTKGFVITRVHTADIPLITDPVEGMMIYDLDIKCLKINTTGTTSGWSCFDKPACP